MTASNQAIINAFVTNIQQIENLLDFDQLLVEMPIHLLERVEAAQTRLKLQHPEARVDKPLQFLRNIRRQEQMRPRLNTIRNQSVVLAVSHFTATVRSLCIAQLAEAIANGNSVTLDRSLTAPVRELRKLTDNAPVYLARALVLEKDVSFQDMKSIQRAMKDLLGREIPRDIHVNDIVIAQAARHAIVHNAGAADARLLHQIRDARPTQIRFDFIEGRPIEFSDSDVRTIGVSMTAYLHALIKPMFTTTESS